jgi:hypothetical protein
MSRPFYITPIDARGSRPDEFLDRDALKAIGARYRQQFVGAPLPPKP